MEPLPWGPHAWVVGGYAGVVVGAVVYAPWTPSVLSIALLRLPNPLKRVTKEGFEDQLYVDNESFLQVHIKMSTRLIKIMNH